MRNVIAIASLFAVVASTAPTSVSAGTQRTLFDRPAGVAQLPVGRLVADPLGNLYDATTLGGTGTGTIYRLSPPGAGLSAWSLTVLHAFRPGDGSYPVGGLVRDGSGRLFGTTSSGGAGHGTVFILEQNPITLDRSLRRRTC